jgi:hypothetical protein
MGPHRNSRFMTAFRLASLSFIISLTQTESALGQPCDPRATLGRSFLSPPCKRSLDYALEALDQLGKAAAAKAELSRQIEAARQRFFRSYPNGPDRVQAEAAFASLLTQKDLYYLYLSLYGSSLRPRESPATPRNQSAAQQLDLIFGLGGKLDGGILPAATPEFDEWTRTFREALGRGTVRSFSDLTGRFRDAFQKSQDYYQAYVTARDWAEFDTAGREPEGFSSPDMYGAMLLLRYDKFPWPEAVAEYNRMAELLGSRSVESAAQKVHAAPKDKFGNIVRSEALGLTPMRRSLKKGPSGADVEDNEALAPEGAILVLSDKPLRAFVALATSGDARGYLLRLAAEDAVNHVQQLKKIDERKSFDWRYAGASYRRWVNSFGESTILKVADQVRGSRKRLESGNLAAPASIGATRLQPYLAFQDILIHNDVRGYVRAILSFNQNLDSAEAVNSAYQKLVSEHGEKGILDVAQRMAARSGPAMASYPNPTYTSEFTMLSGLLGGSLQLGEKPPVSDVQLVDNPEYLAWSGFAAGAKATYMIRTWQLVGPRNNPRSVPDEMSIRETYLLQSIDSQGAHVWLTETVFHSGKPKPSRDREITIPAKIRPKAATRSEDGSVKESGEEILEINGKKVLSRWQSVTSRTTQRDIVTDITTKEWTSDEVPGGRVRSRREGLSKFTGGVNETILESFEGTRNGNPRVSGEQTVNSASPASSSSTAPCTSAPSATPQSRGKASAAGPPIVGSTDPCAK